MIKLKHYILLLVLIIFVLPVTAQDDDLLPVDANAEQTDQQIASQVLGQINSGAGEITLTAEELAATLREQGYENARAGDMVILFGEEPTFPRDELLDLLDYPDVPLLDEDDEPDQPNVPLLDEDDEPDQPNVPLLDEDDEPDQPDVPLLRDDDEIARDIADKLDASTEDTVSLDAQEIDFLLRKTREDRLSLEELNVLLGDEGEADFTLEEISDLIGENDTLTREELHERLEELSTLDDVKPTPDENEEDTPNDETQAADSNDGIIQPQNGTWYGRVILAEAVQSGCPGGVLEQAASQFGAGDTPLPFTRFSDPVEARNFFPSDEATYSNPVPNVYVASIMVGGGNSVDYIYEVTSETTVDARIEGAIAGCSFEVPIEATLDNG